MKRPKVMLQRRGFGIFGDGECRGYALSVAMLAANGELPLQEPDTEGAIFCDVNCNKVLVWACQFFSSSSEMWAFINGFDGKPRDDDHPTTWEAGRNLSIELIGPIY